MDSLLEAAVEPEHFLQVTLGLLPAAQAQASSTSTLIPRLISVKWKRIVLVVVGVVVVGVF